MPEIWLPYGSVEVAVTIKAENVAEQIEPRYPTLGGEEVQRILGGIDAKGRILILAPKPTEASNETVRMLIENLVGRGIAPKDIAVTAQKESLSSLKRSLEEWHIQPSTAKEPAETIGVVEDVEVKIHKVFNEYETKIIVSDVGFDPLFGFDGGPPSIIRYLGGPLMAKSFSRRNGDMPTPGEVTDASRFADDVARMLGGFTSIEALAGVGGLSGIHVGGLIEAHRAASDQLASLAKVALEDDMQAILVSPGGLQYDQTLASALRSLWNVVGGLREKGAIALLAECSGGLGSRALELYVSGRLDIEGSAERVGYIEGMEDISYLKTVLRKYTVVLVSTLPNYYAEVKMGMHTCPRARDALAYILSTTSPRIKIHVVPHSSTTLITSRRR